MKKTIETIYVGHDGQEYKAIATIENNEVIEYLYYDEVWNDPGEREDFPIEEFETKVERNRKELIKEIEKETL